MRWLLIYWPTWSLQTAAPTAERLRTSDGWREGLMRLARGYGDEGAPVEAAILRTAVDRLLEEWVARNAQGDG